MGKTRRSEESEGAGAPEATELPPEPEPEPTGGAEKRRPRDWRAECGVLEWAHVAARTVHGWVEHRYHAGKPMQVTRDDYLAAVKAANDNKGAVEPHGPALSEHKGKGI